MVNQIIAWVGTAIVGFGIISKFLMKYRAKVLKGIVVADELLDVCRTVLEATKDGKISKQEVEKIANEIEELQKALKG